MRHPNQLVLLWEHYHGTLSLVSALHFAAALERLVELDRNEEKGILIERVASQGDISDMLCLGCPHTTSKRTGTPTQRKSLTLALKALVEVCQGQWGHDQQAHQSTLGLAQTSCHLEHHCSCLQAYVYGSPRWATLVSRPSDLITWQPPLL
jgi:hypothetical protein